MFSFCVLRYKKMFGEKGRFALMVWFFEMCKIGILSPHTLSWYKLKQNIIFLDIMCGYKILETWSLCIVGVEYLTLFPPEVSYMNENFNNCERQVSKGIEKLFLLNDIFCLRPKG